MSVGIILGLAAVAASIYLLFGAAARSWAVGAAVASGIHLAIALGWASLRIAHVPLQLVIGIAIAVCGGAIFFRASAKGEVAAAALVAFVGIVRVLGALS